MNLHDKIQEIIDDEVEDGYTIAYLRRVQEMIKADGGYTVLADVRSDIRRMINDASENFRYNDSMGIVAKLKSIDYKLQKISEYFN